MQAALLAQARGRSLAEAARTAPVSYRILTYRCFQVGRQRERQKRPLPRRLGVDEFATRKGHRYATVVVALTAHRVCGVAPERTQAALESLLWAAGARPERVREVVIDMWEAYYQAVKVCCPRARITIDRFHVERHVFEAVDKCRKRLSQGQRKKDCPLKAARHLLVTPLNELSKEQKQERKAL